MSEQGLNETLKTLQGSLTEVQKGIHDINFKKLP